MIETIMCVAVAKALVFDKIVTISKEYGVSEGVMDYVVRNESGYDNCVVGDTHLIDPEGNMHMSLGLVQINKYYNPDVSSNQAFDVDFSLRFLAQHIKDGLGSRWTTYRKYTKLFTKT